jgi:hypothetical protein
VDYARVDDAGLLVAIAAGEQDAWTSPGLADTLGFVVNSKYISVSDCL